MGKRVTLRIRVTPQTAYHLRRMSMGRDAFDYGRVVDKLVRDRATLLKEAMRLGPKNRGKITGAGTRGDEI